MTDANRSPEAGGSVCALFGGAPAGEADAEIIERLEELLEQARRGEIACIAYAYADPGKTKKTGWIGQQGTTDTLGASVSLLFRDYLQEGYPRG